MVSLHLSKTQVLKNLLFPFGLPTEEELNFKHQHTPETQLHKTDTFDSQLIGINTKSLPPSIAVNLICSEDQKEMVSEADWIKYVKYWWVFG